MTSRPGTRPRPASSGPAADGLRGERHDHDGHPAHDPDKLPDAWVRELIEAAPPLTGEQRRALAAPPEQPSPGARPAARRGGAGPGTVTGRAG